MQVSLQTAEGLERRLNVEVPEQQIADKIRARLNEVARTTRIDGFRPGRAPAKVVERQFGARIRHEVLNEVVRSTFTEAVTSQQLRPVADPVIDPISAEPGSGLSYTAVFEIYPDIVLAPCEGLRVKRLQCAIGDVDVDKMIEVLRQQHTTWQDVEREARDVDRLTIDFKGMLDGQPFDGGSADNFQLVLNGGRMIEGFEAGLVGAKPAETRDLRLQFPATYHKSELAGKPVEFHITVRTVAEPVLPELNDEFFAKFGVTEGGMAAFRREVQDNMERERDRTAERQFHQQVLEAVRDANQFNVPRVLVNAEAERMHTEMQRNLRMRGIDPSTLGPMEPARYEQSATQRVKLGLIMAEIVRQARIVVEPSKVRTRVAALAASYEQPEALMKWYYEDPRRLQEVEAMCLEDEAVNWVAARAQVTDMAISFDDLMNPGQTSRNSELEGN
ncbi:MAG: trigger factor [Gammaproteobacteria bacterium]|nr:trigger factor [Gammaproteobacteria bacterium]